MSKVYLVHSESGEYSDWTFVPLAAFTTCEAAVKWLEGMPVPLMRNRFGGGDYSVRSMFEWRDAEAYGMPTTDDGTVWTVRNSIGGEPVRAGYEDPSWYIDELELDPEAYQ